MNQNQREVLSKILAAVPKMSEFEQGRLYGRAEAMEEENEKKAREEKKEESA